MTLLELLQLMRKHLALMIVLPVLCAVVAAVVSFGFIPNEYTASTEVYVLVKGSNEENGGSMNSTLSASQMITNDVAELIESDRVKKDTAEALHMSSLNDYKIAVSSESTTRVLSISVTGQDPATTAFIANELARNTSTVAQEVMDVQAVNAIDEATTPSSPSGPNRTMYVAVAFLAGLFLAVAIVVLMDMLNTRVRGAKEVEELLDIPVIARVPLLKERR